MKNNKSINSVKCLECGMILTSEYTHDFKMCGCPNQTFCDGGNDYRRCGGVDFGKIATYNNETGEYVQMKV